jgi:hypothetical protein
MQIVETTATATLIRRGALDRTTGVETTEEAKARRMRKIFRKHGVTQMGNQLKERTFPRGRRTLVGENTVGGLALEACKHWVLPTYPYLASSSNVFEDENHLAFQPSQVPRV